MNALNSLKFKALFIKAGLTYKRAHVENRHIRRRSDLRKPQ
jgi:hypothetical protein